MVILSHQVPNKDFTSTSVFQATKSHWVPCYLLAEKQRSVWRQLVSGTVHNIFVNYSCGKQHATSSFPLSRKKIHRTNNVANVLWIISKGVAISFEAEFFIIVLLWVKDPSESFAVKKVQMQSKILCPLWVNIVRGECFLMHNNIGDYDISVISFTVHSFFIVNYCETFDSLSSSLWNLSMYVTFHKSVGIKKLVIQS